ncbi:unnamed protein product, partial [Ranitomeya imitator]
MHLTYSEKECEVGKNKQDNGQREGRLATVQWVVNFLIAHRGQRNIKISGEGLRRCSDTDNDVNRCSVAVWSLESCHTDSSPATNDAGNQDKHRVTKRRALGTDSGRPLLMHPMILFALAAAAWHWLLQDIVPVYQIKGISKLVKLCLPKVQCFCDSLTSAPSERQFNALLMSVASLLANPVFRGFIAVLEVALVEVALLDTGSYQLQKLFNELVHSSLQGVSISGGDLVAVPLQASASTVQSTRSQGRQNPAGLKANPESPYPGRLTLVLLCREPVSKGNTPNYRADVGGCWSERSRYGVYVPAGQRSRKDDEGMEDRRGADIHYLNERYHVTAKERRGAGITEMQVRGRGTNHPVTIRLGTEGRKATTELIVSAGVYETQKKVERGDNTDTATHQEQLQQQHQQRQQGLDRVTVLYTKCHCPVPQVSVSLSCTPSVSVLYPKCHCVTVLYPKCQCHCPVPQVSVSLSCTPSVSVTVLYPKCQCHCPVPQVSVSLSCTPSVIVTVLYPKCQCHCPVPQWGLADEAELSWVGAAGTGRCSSTELGKCSSVGQVQQCRAGAAVSGRSSRVGQEQPSRAGAAESGRSSRVGQEQPSRAGAAESGRSSRVGQEQPSRAGAAESGRSSRVGQEQPSRAGAAESGRCSRVGPLQPSRADAAESGRSSRVGQEQQSRAGGHRGGQLQPSRAGAAEPGRCSGAGQVQRSRAGEAESSWAGAGMSNRGSNVKSGRGSLAED